MPPLAASIPERIGPALILALVTPAHTAHAQQASAPPRFKSIDRYVESGGVQLSGGKPARASDWKAIAISVTAKMKCTAVLIGRQVVATSAHCVDGKPLAAQPKIMLGGISFGSQDYDFVECTFHPDYERAPANGNYPRNARDFALCKLDRRVPDVEPETIGKTAISHGDPIVLMGLGCHDLKVVDGVAVSQKDPAANPVLRIGDQRVADTALPLGRSNPSFARTVSHGREPNLCPGDSGGPVYVGVTADNPVAGRRISGFNAAFDGDWDFSGTNAVFYSYLAPAGEIFREWAKTWSDKRSLKICGIQLDPGIGGCRL